MVRGLNEKLNYFMDEHNITDIEFRVPLQKITDNSHMGNGIGFKFLNQRKIYWDNTRFLSTRHNNALYLPRTRMNVTFWKNLFDLGEDPAILRSSTDFSQFNQEFEGYSLFHYYAKDQEVIRMLHKKYLEVKNDDDATKEQIMTPLILL